MSEQSQERHLTGAAELPSNLPLTGKKKRVVRTLARRDYSSVERPIGLATQQHNAAAIVAAVMAQKRTSQMLPADVKLGGKKGATSRDSGNLLLKVNVRCKSNNVVRLESGQVPVSPTASGQGGAKLRKFKLVPARDVSRNTGGSIENKANESSQDRYGSGVKKNGESPRKQGSGNYRRQKQSSLPRIDSRERRLVLATSNDYSGQTTQLSLNQNQRSMVNQAIRSSQQNLARSGSLPGQQLQANRTQHNLNSTTKAPLPDQTLGRKPQELQPPQTQKLKSNQILPKQAKSTRFDSTERGETKLPSIFRDNTERQIFISKAAKKSVHDILNGSIKPKQSSSVNGRFKTNGNSSRQTFNIVPTVASTQMSTTLTSKAPQTSHKDKETSGSLTRPDRGTQVLPRGVRQSSQQGRPLTNLLTLNEEDQMVTLNDSGDEQNVTPLAIRTEEKQLRSRSKNLQLQETLTTEQSSKISQTPCPAPLSSHKKQRTGKQRQPSQGTKKRLIQVLPKSTTSMAYKSQQNGHVSPSKSKNAKQLIYTPRAETSASKKANGLMLSSQPQLALHNVISCAIQEVKMPPQPTPKQLSQSRASKNNATPGVAMTPKINNTSKLEKRFVPNLASSQAKLVLAYGNKGSGAFNSTTDSNIGASMTKVSRNQLTMARIRSYDRKDTGGEVKLSSPREGITPKNNASSTYRRPRHFSRSPAKNFNSFDDYSQPLTVNPIPVTVITSGLPFSGSIQVERQLNPMENSQLPSRAQPDINAIREEQDLEDSGAYGTTPSKKDDTMRSNQEAQQVLITTTNFEETTIEQNKDPAMVSLETETQRVQDPSEMTQTVTISDAGQPSIEVKSKPPLASQRSSRPLPSGRKPPTASSKKSHRINHQQEEISLQSSTLNERVSLHDQFAALRSDPEINNRFRDTKQTTGSVRFGDTLNDRDVGLITQQAWNRAQTASHDQTGKRMDFVKQTQPDSRAQLIATPQAKSVRQVRREERQEEDDEVERLSSEFDRLSNDVSGFGPNHREKSEDSSDERESNVRGSCTTTGFDFYVNHNMNSGMNPNAMMINRERELFSPPFKTRAEMGQEP